MQSYHHNTAPISTTGKEPATAKKSMSLQPDPQLPKKTAKSRPHSTSNRPQPKPSASGPVSDYDPPQFSSSTTWTTSSCDFGLFSEGDEVEDREDFVGEYNRTAKKYGIRPIVPRDFDTQSTRTVESKGRRRQASSETEATGPQRSHRPPSHRRSISSLTLHLGNSGRKDNLKDTNLADLVRLCGKSLLYLPTEYAPSPLVLPTCLRATAQYLVQQANTRGIFRVPGAVRVVDKLYDYYCTSENTEEIDQTTRRPILPSHIKFNVHDVASTFKKLLSRLPGGILGSLSILEALVAIHNQLDYGPEISRTKATRLRARLIALAVGSISSQYQRELICAVFGLLSLIGRAAETTPREDGVGHPLPTGDLMGYNALGIVFGPLLVGDLLDSYNTKLASPAVGLVLFPVTSRKSKKSKYLHRHEHGHNKARTTDDETTASTTVDKLYVVNNITEMVITNWREVVRHMRSLDVLKTQRNVEQHRAASKKRALRSSASDSLAGARYQTWEYRRLPVRSGNRSRSQHTVHKPQSSGKPIMSTQTIRIADETLETGSEESDSKPPAKSLPDQEQQQQTSGSSLKVSTKASAHFLSPTVEESPLPKTSSTAQREGRISPTPPQRPSTEERIGQRTVSRGASPAPSSGAQAPKDHDQSASHGNAKVPLRHRFHVHHGAHHEFTSHSDTFSRKQLDPGTPDAHDADSASIGQARGPPQEKKHLDSGKSNGWLPAPKSLHKKWSSSRAPKRERSSNDNLSTRTEPQVLLIDTQAENLGRDSENLGRDSETVSLPSKRPKDKHWFRPSRKVADASRDDRSEISTQGAASLTGEPELHSRESERSLRSLARKERRLFRSAAKVFSRRSTNESLAATEGNKDVALDWKRRLLNKFSEGRHRPTTPPQTEGAFEEPQDIPAPTATISTAQGDAVSIVAPHPTSRSQDLEQRVSSRSELGNVKAIVAVFDSPTQDPQIKTSIGSAGRSRGDLRSISSFQSQHTENSSRTTVLKREASPAHNDPSSAAKSSKGKNQPVESSTPKRELTPTTGNSNIRSSPLRRIGKGKITRVPQGTIPSPTLSLFIARNERQASAAKPLQGHERRLDGPSSLGTMAPQEQEPPVAQHLVLIRPSSTESSSNIQDPSSDDHYHTQSQQPQDGSPRPAARYASTNSVLHEQVRTLRNQLESRTEETTKLRRRLEAREMLDIGSLLEQLRQAKREARMWRKRAEAAERRVMALESFSARFRDLKGVCDEEMEKFHKEVSVGGAPQTSRQGYGGQNNTAGATHENDGPSDPEYRDTEDNSDSLDNRADSSYKDAAAATTGDGGDLVSGSDDVFEDALQPQSHSQSPTDTLTGREVLYNKSTELLDLRGSPE